MPYLIAGFGWLELLQFAACVAGILALVQAVLLVVQTLEHARYRVRRLNSQPRIRPSGHAAVFVACKGIDLGMAENLRPLFEQDYPDYQLVLIVGSRDDPACAIVRALMAEHPYASARLLIAGRASDCGQKVHGLLRATQRLAPEVAYLAFADSDVRPSATWLRRMIERLVTRSDTGAVTGYRWLLPERWSASGLVLANLNNAIAALFTSGGHHLLWGGCWAIRRELFDKLDIRACWREVLSDDLAASLAIHRARLRIKFEPSCVLPTSWDEGLVGMCHFLYRQHFMLWRYAPRWSQAMLAAAIVTICGYAGPLAAALLTRVCTGRWPPGLLVIVALVYGLQAVRGQLRAALARRYFPQRQRTLAAAGWFDTFAGPLPAIVNLVALAASAFGRRVNWRQIGYVVDRQGTVVSVTHGRRRSPAPAQQPLGVPVRA